MLFFLCSICFLTFSLLFTLPLSSLFLSLPFSSIFLSLPFSSLFLSLPFSLLFLSLPLSSLHSTQSPSRSELIKLIAASGFPEGPVDDPNPDRTNILPHNPKLCATCLVDRTKATMHCSVRDFKYSKKNSSEIEEMNFMMFSSMKMFHS